MRSGAAALWRGFQPALLRQVSYTGMSFVLYEPVRNAIAGDVPKEEIPFVKRVLAGGTAGGLSIIMMNPTDVVSAAPPRVRTTARLPPRTADARPARRTCLGSRSEGCRL